MSTITASLLSYLLIYKYVFLFFTILASAIIVPLPENLMLLATGAFASQGYFNFWLSFLTLLVGNITGDLLDFTFADLLGRESIQKWRVRMPWFITRLEHYIEQHTGITVFCTRFVGAIGSLTNFISGLSNVSYKKFLFYDFLGNAVSIFYVLYIGYLLGNNWVAISGVMSTVGWLLFAIAVVGIAFILWRRRATHHNSTLSE